MNSQIKNDNFPDFTYLPLYPSQSNYSDKNDNVNSKSCMNTIYFSLSIALLGVDYLLALLNFQTVIFLFERHSTMDIIAIVSIILYGLVKLYAASLSICKYIYELKKKTFELPCALVTIPIILAVISFSFLLVFDLTQKILIGTLIFAVLEYLLFFFSVLGYFNIKP